LAGCLLALLLVWGVDRTGLWGALGVDPNIAAKWQPERLSELPTYYVLPGVPTGGVHKRRGGPSVETRRVLAEASEAFGRSDHPYGEEPPVRISRGRYGFRDELPAEPGGHAILGASFVEAGFVEADDTIPGWLRRDHGVAASNFGLAGAGGRTLAHALERFALPTQPDRVTWVFSEGYGFAALGKELAAAQRHHRSEPRLGPFWRSVFEASEGMATSAWRRAVDCGTRWRHPLEQPLRLTPQALPQRAVVSWGGGGSATVDLSGPPPALTFELTRPLFAEVLTRMAGACREAGSAFQVVFVPSRATLFREAAPSFPDYTSGCAEFVLAECQRQGVRVHDATPALREAARAELVVNPVYDLHLNSAGMRAVARVIAAGNRR
jgi:hypothetical protein